MRYMPPLSGTGNENTWYNQAIFYLLYIRNKSKAQHGLIQAHDMDVTDGVSTRFTVRYHYDTICKWHPALKQLLLNSY